MPVAALSMCSGAVERVGETSTVAIFTVMGHLDHARHDGSLLMFAECCDLPTLNCHFFLQKASE